MYFVCFHPACVLLICLFVICHRALASMFALPVVGKCGVSSCFWFVNTMSSQPGPPPCRHLLLLNAPIPWNPGSSGLCGRAHWFPLNALSRSRGTLSLSPKATYDWYRPVVHTRVGRVYWPAPGINTGSKDPTSLGMSSGNTSLKSVAACRDLS